MSNVSGRLGRTLSGIAATAAVAATLILLPTTATAGTEADGPHYQEPVVDQCHNYTFTQGNAMADATPVVECASPHTARVVAVVQLPAALTWDSSFSQIGAAASKKCSPLWDLAVGGSTLKRRMSAYARYIFFPNASQKQHGARWIRCDVALWGHQALLPLPTDAKPALPAGAVPYAVTRCKYGTKYFVTACSRPHAYRATGGFTYANGPFPGDNAINAALQRRCPGLTTTRHWIAWGPTRESWKFGDRIGTCYSNTTH